MTQTVVRMHFMSGISAAGVYKYQLRAINELNVATRQEIAAITLKMIHRVLRNFINRLQMLIANESYHLTSIIFETHCK